MIKLAAFAMRHWRETLLAALVVSLLGALAIQRAQTERLRSAVDLAEKNEDLARTSLSVERGNVDKLAAQLATEQAQRRALETAAKDARIAQESALRAAEEAATALGYALQEERANDPELDRVLRYELPHNVLRLIPE